MAEAGDTVLDAGEDTPAVRNKRRWGKRLGWALALLLAPLVLVAGFLSTPIGKRYIADQIAAVAPASGLRFAVGRIEGDIYSKAVLRDVRVSDPKGVFLTIPEVALEWRPLNWLWSGLDIRELTARRGRLTRLPELLPGDPDAPLLPDFDIRVDRLAIENLVIAEGVATARAERVNALAQIDIREGRALVDAKAELGQRDRIALLLDAEPDGDRFDLEGEYRAPAGGVLAGLAGFAQGYDARIAGDGTWQRWRGWAVARQLEQGSGKPVSGPAVAAFQVTNTAGKIGVLGRVRPGLAGESLLARAVGEKLALAASFTLEDGVLEGRAALVSRALDLRGAGVVDLAENRVEGARTSAALRDPDLLGAGWRFENTRIAADIEGDFRDLAIDHRLAVGRLLANGVEATGLVQEGLAQFDGKMIAVPLAVTAERITTGNQYADPRLVKGKLAGALTYDFARQKLAIDAGRVSFPGLEGTLALRGDIRAGAYAIAGPVAARASRSTARARSLPMPRSSSSSALPCRGACAPIWRARWRRSAMTPSPVSRAIRCASRGCSASAQTSRWCCARWWGRARG